MANQPVPRHWPPVSTLVAIDKTLFRETESETGETVRYGVPIAAYPSEAGKVIVNSPGSGELKDGREDRWRNLGLYLQERGLASLVTFNAPRPDFQVQLEWEPYSYQGASWNKILIESLSHTIDWSLENAKELCGNASPDIFLTGFSSGGSSVGAVAHRYPSVKRILLLSTYDSVGDPFYEGVTAFTGDIYLVYGDQDPMAGYLARILRTGKFAAKSFLVREAPECGHRFDGEANTKLLTQAFHWAFEGDNSQPLDPGN